jgi:hypothetical protein
MTQLHPLDPPLVPNGAVLLATLGALTLELESTSPICRFTINRNGLGQATLPRHLFGTG